MLCEGRIGLHPPGALGVAFYIHAQADCFVGRGSRGITQHLKAAGRLLLEEESRQRAIPLRGRIFANLLEAEALGRMPELLLVCCNPDQLSEVTGELAGFIESLCGQGRLRSVEDVRAGVPILLLLPNGIVAEQASETYADQLAEARLMDRLPGVDDAMIQALGRRIVRGVSLQAGGRRGSGAGTVYLLERKGMLVFAGGGDDERERIDRILAEHDYPFRHVRGVPGTRVEFDKAMISIVLNVGGLIHMVRPDGSLVDLRMGDLCNDPGQADFVSGITRAVYDIGRAIGAYRPEESYGQVWAGHRETILRHANHVTSSVKAFREALAAGLRSIRLFSNEEWILSPLIRYAGRLGLAREEELLRSLRTRVQESMARAIRCRDRESAGNGSRTRTMKLIAQRNFTVELYDVGADSVCLVGTMLDDEHLVKLEITVYLPDEQITHSRLAMIRVPFPVCREVEAVAGRLVGLRIERGVLNEISRRVGGRTGCSHIKELATNIIYFAATHLVRRRSGMDPTRADFVFRAPEERFTLTKDLLRDSCLAYCQTTPRGLDEQIGIRRVGEEHGHPVPLGPLEPSLGAVLRETTRKWADHVYLRYREGEAIRTLTRQAFADRVFQIARHLVARGIRHGDRICMVSENRAEMYLFELAAAAIGAVSVPVFAGYSRPQVAYVLAHARPRWVVVSGFHQLEKIDRQACPWVERFFCMEVDRRSAEWGAEDFSGLLAGGGAGEDALQGRIDAVRPDDVCIIMYTSGTTGPPKGVQLSHRNLISQQRAIAMIWDAGPQDALMAFLPWHHSFGGLFERFLTLYQGTELCLDDSRGRDLDRLLANWQAFHPTIFCSVPRVHDLLMSRCEEDPAARQIIFDGRLRFVFSAGAPLPATVDAAYRRRNVPVMEGWGLTETSPCVTLSTPEAPRRSGFVGQPIPGVRVRVDADQELLVKGPNVMLGYLDDEDATSRAIDEDGWFHTGDLGEFTPDGLRIFGRKDGAFKLTTGEKVHPQRIETVLVNESPIINSAVVIGSGRDYVGAILYPNWPQVSLRVAPGRPAGEPADADAVRRLFAAELARLNPLIEVKYQRIRRAWLADREPSLERGELTSSGKLVRKAILGSYQREIDALYAADPPEGVIEVPQPDLRRVCTGVA
jgi:long-subunit acyl-CoA synthetase (AMP-forming)